MDRSPSSPSGTSAVSGHMDVEPEPEPELEEEEIMEVFELIAGRWVHVDTVRYVEVEAPRSAVEQPPISTPSGGSGGARGSLDSLGKDRYGCDGGGGTSADATCCAICLESYEVGDEQSVMPCAGSHRFHRKCLGEWLARSPLCPLCRRPLPA